MSPGSSTESYPAFARIGLRENPGKNLNQVSVRVISVWEKVCRSSEEYDLTLYSDIYNYDKLRRICYGAYQALNLWYKKCSEMGIPIEDKTLHSLLFADDQVIFAGDEDDDIYEILHALYPSPDIIRNIKSRRLRWAGHVAGMGESRNAYRVLVGRPDGKRPLGRPRRRWEDNIKMDLREVGYDDRDWIHLAQDRDQWRAYVRAAMNLRVP
ncbi:hypothetical protein ANN_21874 [Periplaneta americana]|uniref:Reverse transcriptase n=1 Tax=Periplaneta americana TaxID=6978 RepID=A0ABQ8S6L5_PERAM|nr:hypothetical protein ANN_21874 [Periplaneta americana]